MEKKSVELLWKGLLSVFILAALLAVGFGGLLALEDLETRGEMFDGLGAFIGLDVAGAGAMVGVPSLVAVLVHSRHPRASETLALVVGLTITGVGLVPLTAGLEPWAFLPAALGAVLSVSSVQLLRRPAEQSWTWANS